MLVTIRCTKFVLWKWINWRLRKKMVKNLFLFLFCLSCNCKNPLKLYEKNSLEFLYVFVWTSARNPINFSLLSNPLLPFNEIFLRRRCAVMSAHFVLMNFSFDRSCRSVSGFEHIQASKRSRSLLKLKQKLNLFFHVIYWSPFPFRVWWPSWFDKLVILAYFSCFYTGYLNIFSSIMTSKEEILNYLCP